MEGRGTDKDNTAAIEFSETDNEVFRGIYKQYTETELADLIEKFDEQKKGMATDSSNSGLDK